VIRFIVQTLVVTAVLMSPRFASGEEGRTLPMIGLAIPVDQVSDAPAQKAFRDGLRDLGYVDGKNVTVVVRYANSDPMKLRENIQELIQLKVNVLIGEAPTLREATTTIPIVSIMGDPVRIGLAESLARPGGNVTGLSSQGYDIVPKQLELTKELVPSLKRLYLLFEENADPDLATYADVEFRALARNFGMDVRLLPVRSLEDIRAALKTVHEERPKALMVWSTPLTSQYHRTIMNSVAHRLPVISTWRGFAQAGALLTYSVDFLDLFRREATYVDKILKGAKAGDLPIEQPTKFELIVNLRTAKALGVTVPESIIVRASEIIR